MRSALRSGLALDGVVEENIAAAAAGSRYPQLLHYQGCDGFLPTKALTDEVHRGLSQVIEGSRSLRLEALVCSEHDPTDCHRGLLIGFAAADPKALRRETGCRLLALKR